jgi:hypothetical protein
MTALHPKTHTTFRTFAALTSSKGREETTKMLNQTRYTNQQWGALLRQIIFVSFFTVYILFDHNADAYWIARGITTQIAEMEFLEEDSPTFGKTFNDIATVQDIEMWLHGPMLETFFGRNTYDGYSSHRPKSDRPYGNGGFVLGYNKILGSVRISQLRSQSQQCALPAEFANFTYDYKWECYSKEEGTFMAANFNLETEDKQDFGSFRHNQSYTYNGLTGAGKLITDTSMTPDHERAKGLLSWYRTRERRILYPPPAFGVYLDPMQGYEKARSAVEAMYGSGYVDLHTKALFVDATLYNADLQFMLHVRLTVEVGSAGGAVSSYDYFEFKPYHVKSSDYVEYAYKGRKRYTIHYTLRIQR